MKVHPFQDFGVKLTPQPASTYVEGEEIERPPIRMMRQAGRYMKVYQDLVKKYPTFKERSEQVDLAVEISLQVLLLALKTAPKTPPEAEVPVLLHKWYSCDHGYFVLGSSSYSILESGARVSECFFVLLLLLCDPPLHCSSHGRRSALTASSSSPTFSRRSPA